MAYAALPTQCAFPSQGGYPTQAVPPAALGSEEAGRTGQPDLSALLQRPQDASDGRRSECNVSVSGISNRDTAKVQAGLERRIAWLEEDVALLHRRQREEFEKSTGAMSSTSGAQSGSLPPAWAEARHAELEAGLRHLQDSLSSITQQVEVDLTTLGQHLDDTRRAFDSRLCALEETLVNEKQERMDQIQAFSQEIVRTIHVAIAHMDEILSATAGGAKGGGAGARFGGASVEQRLNSLMRRVDGHLATDVAEFEERLAADAAAGGTQPAWSQDHQQVSQSLSGAAEEDADQLIRSWDRLRQENEILKAQIGQGGSVRAQVIASPVKPSVFAAPARPTTVQVVRLQTAGGARPSPLSPTTAARQLSMPGGGVVVRRGGP